jgi:hypothetical protein
MVTATCEQSSKAVTVKVVQADLDIQGLSEADEDSVGGLVVRNFDTNSAPRKRIIIQKIAPSSFTGNVILTSGSTKIKAFTAATGGTEITFNGTDNKFANSGLPKDLFVEGTGFSDTMRDVQLRTEIENVANSNDTVSFTVLWVDQPVVLTAGTISADNDKKNGYQGWTVANTLSLGVQFYNANFGARMGWGTEAGALVHPSNFNYPGNDLKLEREVEFHDWIGNGTSSIDQRSFSASFRPASGTGSRRQSSAEWDYLRLGCAGISYSQRAAKPDTANTKQFQGICLNNDRWYSSAELANTKLLREILDETNSTREWQYLGHLESC